VVVALLWATGLPVARAATPPLPARPPVVALVEERGGELRLSGLTSVTRSRFRLAAPDREVVDLVGVQPPPAFCATRSWCDDQGRLLLRSGWDPALRRWRLVRPTLVAGGATVEDLGDVLVFRGLAAKVAPLHVPPAPPIRVVTRPDGAPPTWGPLLPLWQPLPRPSIPMPRPVRTPTSVRTPAISRTPATEPSVLPAATAAVAAAIPSLHLPPLLPVGRRPAALAGEVMLGPFLPGMFFGPPSPGSAPALARGTGSRQSAGPASAPASVPPPARAAWEVVRHGTDEEGEPDVMAQAPWPREPQRIERFSLRKQRLDTVFEVVAARSLTVWMEAQPKDARWILRFPRAEVQASPPRPRAATRRLALGRDARSWALTLELDPGQYDVEETRINEGRGLQLRFHRRKPPVAERPLIVLDPGHGGADPGALGPLGVTESQVTLDVARRLRPLLEHAGFHVVPTRTVDTAVRLADRAALAEALGAVALVSIHCNSSPLREARGIETWFRHEAGSGLARKVHEALVKATGRPDRGVRQGRLMVLKTPGMPGVLVEIGFLSHPDEASRLLDEEHQVQMAEGLARGLRLLVEAGGMSGSAGRRRLQDQRGAEPKVGALGAAEKAPHRPRG